MGKKLKLSQAADMIGVNKVTLRNWANEGKMEHIVTPSGHRLFDEEVIRAFIFNEKVDLQKENPIKKVCIYARVSTKKQMESGNLDRQISRLTNHAVEKGYKIENIFKEVASGINENRKELKKLLDYVKENNESIVLIEYKDRLARFGFQYLEKYIQDFGSTIEVVEEIGKDDEKELIEDLIAITTSFSARIYGKRGGKKATEKISFILKNAEKED